VIEFSIYSENRLNSLFVQSGLVESGSPLDILHAVALALIQGITEFLPISSSGHLVLPSLLLDWPDQGLAFDTAVHLGSLLAVVIYFRHDLVSLASKGLSQLVLRKPSEEGQYAVNLLIASLPILPIGLFSRFFIEDHLRALEVITVATIIFAFALWYADRLKHETAQVLTMPRALMIGIAQCLALVPGTSRSGITMTAALMLGFSRTESARISFLISIPTILGAAVLKLWDLMQNPESPDWFALAVGTTVSAIAAFSCITLLLKFIEQIGYLPFVFYRLLLGAVLVAVIISQ
jgi:undecaprenyl-diphosphatase